MMMMGDDARTRNVVVALAALAVLALLWFLFLREDEPPVRHLENRPQAKWIVLEREGGFTGVADRMTLSADGHAVIRDRTEGTALRLRVPPKKLEKISAALEEVAWDELSTSPGGQMICADCFIYEIEHDGYFATGTLFTKEERSIRPLVTELFAIIDRARRNAS